MTIVLLLVFELQQQNTDWPSSNHQWSLIMLLVMYVISKFRFMIMFATTTIFVVCTMKFTSTPLSHNAVPNVEPDWKKNNVASKLKRHFVETHRLYNWHLHHPWENNNHSPQKNLFATKLNKSTQCTSLWVIWNVYNTHPNKQYFGI